MPNDTAANNAAAANQSAGPGVEGLEGLEDLVADIDGLPKQKATAEKAAGKINLYVGGADRWAVAKNIIQILVTSPHVFLLNGLHLARVAQGKRKGTATTAIIELTQAAATNEVYRLAGRIWTMKENKKGEWVEVDASVPGDAIGLAMAEPEKWGLKAICGITSAPLLREGGDIHYADGYDEETELWCHNVPKPRVPDKPTYLDAGLALLSIREQFKTFPFADAEMVHSQALGVPVVDLQKPIGMDESSFLNAVLTAVCRASLYLAPGWALTAPEGGSGSGKGLLLKSVSYIAFGISPSPHTHNGNDEEFDKRIAGAYKNGAPIIYIDNVNSTMLKSDSLASKMTERPFNIRVLGVTDEYTIDSSAWVVITGNGLTVTEDLVRRFLTTLLDAKVENASTRPFKDGSAEFLATIKARRLPLLAAALTIWRWGQQGCQGVDIKPKGKTLGSFETWGRWVRDPLLALGCKDPAVRISNTSANDLTKIRTIEMFMAWHGKHGCKQVSCKEAAAEHGVAKLFVAEGKVWSGTWQSLSPHLNAKDSTRAAGAVFQRVEDNTRGGGAVSYQLKVDDVGKWTAMTGIEVDPETGEAAQSSAPPSDKVVQFSAGSRQRSGGDTTFQAEERPAAKGPLGGI